jgi:hypothetical protein
VLQDTFQGSQVVYSLTLISCCFRFWLHRLRISCAVIFARRARSPRFLSPIFLLRSILGSALNFWFPREHSGPRSGFDSIAAYAPPWIQSARSRAWFRSDYHLRRSRLCAVLSVRRRCFVFCCFKSAVPWSRCQFFCVPVSARQIYCQGFMLPPRLLVSAAMSGQVC